MCIKAPKRASSYYGIGTLASLALHLLLIVVALGFEPSGASLSKPVVYSVSLEGGRKLGGISQAPSKKKSEKAPPKKVQATAKPKPQKK